MPIRNEQIGIHIPNQATLRNNIILGKELGYPDCCINEFVSDIKNGLAPAASRGLIGNNSGFVPCRYHSQLIDRCVIFLEDLILVNQRDVQKHGEFIEEWDK